MTWFIDTGRFPVVGTIAPSTYSGGERTSLPSVAPAKRRSPYSDEIKRQLPTNVDIWVRSASFIEHIIVDQSGMLFLSRPALDVLSELQAEGWEAFPFQVRATDPRKQRFLAGNTYYLVNLFVHRDFVDIAKGNIPPKIVSKGTSVEKAVYWLSDAHRQVVIKRDLIGEYVFWLGDGVVLGNTYFVADRLKDAWCALGMTPDVFEPCVDI